jgi:hypothetical protein
MLTSAERRARAEQKLVEADRRKELRADAECSLLLAERMERLEVPVDALAEYPA